MACKDGVVHMVGNGCLNPAGAGDTSVLRAVNDEAPLPPDEHADTEGDARL